MRFAHTAVGAPTGLYAHAVKNHYDSAGHLVAVQEVRQDGSLGTIYWQADSADALGNLTKAHLGVNTDSLCPHFTDLKCPLFNEDTYLRIPADAGH